MRVRCITEVPPDEEADLLRRPVGTSRRTFGVTVGMEYLVFGLRVVKGYVWVDVAQEFEQLVPVPLSLFEITDPSIPGLWQARVENRALFLWPPSFFEHEFYHEDLVEGVPSVVEDFRRVRRRLELESTLMTE